MVDLCEVFDLHFSIFFARAEGFAWPESFFCNPLMIDQ
jgi:hypothetical protein